MFRLISLSIVLIINLGLISSEDCPQIRLIQPLDESTGLSYIVITNSKYYLIKEEQLEGNESLQALSLPQGFESASGVIPYFNDLCSPPDNYVIVYKFELDPQNQMYDWSVRLNLLHSTESPTNWTERSRFLPGFLQYDNYMNAYRFSFSMLWHQRKVLYMVQLPEEGAPIRPNDYHTIEIGTNRTCEQHQYLGDYEMKITEILNPYENFMSCFIHNDRQIICFGPKGFTSFDIDLEETKEGHLRVKNATKDFQRIPIMKIIEEIRENCERLTPTVSEITSTTSTTQSSTQTEESVETTESDESTKETIPPIPPILTTIGTKSPQEYNGTKSSDEPQLPKEDNNWLLFWLFLLLIFIIIVISALGLLYCLKRKAKPKDESPPDAPTGGQQSNLGQMSNNSMRSQFDDKNRLNESTIDSGPSMRSITKTNGNDMSNASTIGEQPSMRSQTANNMANNGVTPQSTIDSQTSMRSQTIPNDNRNVTQNMSTASAIGDQPSVRSQNENTVPQNDLMASSAVDSNVSMRSVNDIKQKQNQ